MTRNRLKFVPRCEACLEAFQYIEVNSIAVHNYLLVFNQGITPNFVIDMGRIGFKEDVGHIVVHYSIVEGISRHSAEIGTSPENLSFHPSRLCNIYK